MFENLLHAARDLRYWIEIQPVGKVFHPAGGDLRDLPIWRDTCALLDQFPADGLNCGAGPGLVLFVPVAVGDVVAEQEGCFRVAGRRSVGRSWGIPS